VAEAWNFGPHNERPVRWLVERWGMPTMAGEREAREAPVLRVDSTKAQTRLEWRPTWDLAAALDGTIEWYRAVAAGADARALALTQIARFAAPGPPVP
jgi:CDP-glucose 4,6-dehydratase